MIVFLDTNIVIYLIEQPSVWGAKALGRFSGLQAIGAKAAVSDLVRLECRVGPLKRGDTGLLTQYDSFFASSDLIVAPLSRQACDQAAVIRAIHGISTPDALNLAASLQVGCSMFSTNDGRLGRFTGIPVEVLA
jgi:predicted nucleic acid-binding protein